MAWASPQESEDDVVKVGLRQRFAAKNEVVGAPCPEALSISMVSEVVTVLDLILNT